MSTDVAALKSHQILAIDKNDLKEKLVTSARSFDSSPHTKKKIIIFKPDCIKEEAEDDLVNRSNSTTVVECPYSSTNGSTITPRFNASSSTRVRKNTDRLFTSQSPMGTSTTPQDTNLFQTKVINNINKIHYNSPMDNFTATINPEINIEKSLGSSTTRSTYPKKTSLHNNFGGSFGTENIDKGISGTNNEPAFRARKMSLPTLPVTLEVPTTYTRDRSLSPRR